MKFFAANFNERLYSDVVGASNLMRKDVSWSVYSPRQARKEEEAKNILEQTSVDESCSE